jgi:hypothetical protein
MKCSQTHCYTTAAPSPSAPREKRGRTRLLVERGVTIQSCQQHLQDSSHFVAVRSRHPQVRWSRAAFTLCPVVLAVSALSVSTSAEEGQSTSGRKTLARSAGDVPRACTSRNCATVIAVRRLDLHESAPLFGTARDPYPPARFLVQKHKEVWVIELRRQDGTVQSVRLNYPALFKAGDRVLLEGERIRAPE